MSSKIVSGRIGIHTSEKSLAKKSTVLLDFLLKEIDFPDHRLVKHMTQGFRLSGWVCRTGLSPFDPKPPSSTIASQLKNCKGSQHCHLVSNQQAG